MLAQAQCGLVKEAAGIAADLARRAPKDSRVLYAAAPYGGGYLVALLVAA